MAATKNRDVLALRAFVTAQDDRSNFDPATTIVVDSITHSNLQQRHVEVRFDIGETLGDLRQRIHQTTGTPDGDQILQLFRRNDELIHQVTPDVPDKTPLASMLENRGYRIHVVDVNPYSTSAGGALEDTRLVAKFKLTEEQYSARSNTLRHWCQQQQQQNPQFSLREHGQQHAATVQFKRGRIKVPGWKWNEELQQAERDNNNENTNDNESLLYGKLSVEHATVGDRCQVTPGERRGRVAWIGQFDNNNKGGGWWIGVDLDEPLGRNDGSHQGTRYFTTGGAKHGCFVRGPNVQVGDFPEKSLWDDSDEDEL